MMTQFQDSDCLLNHQQHVISGPSSATDSFMATSIHIKVVKTDEDSSASKTLLQNAKNGTVGLLVSLK